MKISKERPINTKVKFYRSLSSLPLSSDGTLVIFDEKAIELNDHLHAFVNKFKFTYACRAGEGLKEFKHFSKHMEKVLDLRQQMKNFERILAVGGGSLTDFAGFVSSILHRGVDFDILPTTWLCALDSAHGGKNALNVSGIKNQVGTFHFPKRVHIVHEVLANSDGENAHAAMGEAAKMALLDKRVWGEWSKLTERSDRSKSNGLTDFNKILWTLLSSLIDAKLKFVHKDPYEKIGIRTALNLGHTMGHVVEALTGLQHGHAVGVGLRFSLQWSLKRKYLKLSTFREIERKLLLPMRIPDVFLVGDSKSVRELLEHDKKRKGDRINFVFLKEIGNPITREVSADEILAESRIIGLI